MDQGKLQIMRNMILWTSISNWTFYWLAQLRYYSCTRGGWSLGEGSCKCINSTWPLIWCQGKGRYNDLPLCFPLLICTTRLLSMWRSFLQLISLSFNLTRLFVGCWELVPYDIPLVVLHTKSIIFFHSWCILGGSVCVWMKRNLFQFIHDKTHFSTSWHAKMSLTLNEPI